MTTIKTLSAIVVLSAALATPVFAQDADVMGPTYHGRSHDQRNFRGAYNASNLPYTNEDRLNLEDFGFSGRDRSHVGGEDPDLRPAGN